MQYPVPTFAPLPRRSTFLTFAFVVAIFAFVLLLIGFFSPGWDVYIFYNGHIAIGLWYVVACVDSACISGSFDVDESLNISLNKDAFLDYQIESSIAMAFSLAGLILTMTCRRFSSLHVPTNYSGNNNNNGLKIAAMVTCGISGVLTIVAASTNCDRVRMQAADSNNIGFPFAAFIFGLGGISNLFVSVILSIHLYKNDVQNKRTDMYIGRVTSPASATAQPYQTTFNPGIPSHDHTPPYQPYAPSHASDYSPDRLQSRYTNRAYDDNYYNRKTNIDRYWDDEPRARVHNSSGYARFRCECRNGYGNCNKDRRHECSRCPDCNYPPEDGYGRKW